MKAKIARDDDDAGGFQEIAGWRRGQSFVQIQRNKRRLGLKQ